MKKTGRGGAVLLTVGVKGVGRSKTDSPFGAGEPCIAYGISHLITQ